MTLAFVGLIPQKHKEIINYTEIYVSGINPHLLNQNTRHTCCMACVFLRTGLHCAVTLNSLQERKEF
jgi:hypothetical protein